MPTTSRARDQAASQCPSQVYLDLVTPSPAPNSVGAPILWQFIMGGGAFIIVVALAGYCVLTGKQKQGACRGKGVHPSACVRECGCVHCAALVDPVLCSMHGIVCVMFAGTGRVHPSSQQGIAKESSSMVGNTVPLRDTAMLVADEEAGAAAIATSPSRRSSTTMSGGDSRNSKTGAGASMGTSSALGSCPDRSSSGGDVDACDVVQAARPVKGQPAMRGRWVRERPVAADIGSHALGEMGEKTGSTQPVVVDSGLAVLEDVVSEAAGTLQSRPSTPPAHTSLARRQTSNAATIKLL
jgi:hypothetical protein